MRKIKKTLLRIVVVPAEIRTGHLPCTNQNRHRLKELADVSGAEPLTNPEIVHIVFI
jgi:hypothetical protein